MAKYIIELQIETDRPMQNAGDIQKLAVAIADTVGQHSDHIWDRHRLAVELCGVEAMDFRIIA
jgi:hypothetical protein